MSERVAKWSGSGDIQRLDLWRADVNSTSKLVASATSKTKKISTHVTWYHENVRCSIYVESLTDMPATWQQQVH